MIGTLLATVLPAFIPVVTDGVKMVISKFTGVEMGEPKNFKDWLELKKLEIEKLKVLGELDKPGANISTWVADFRASFRYFAVGFIIISTTVYYFLPGAKDPAIVNYFGQLAASATFFIIGDRVYLGLKHMK